MIRRLTVLFVVVAALNLGTRPPRQGSTGMVARSSGAPEYKELSDSALNSLKERRTSDAILTLEQGYREAVSRRNPLAACWFLNAAAGAHFQIQEYRQALDEYLRARDLALSAGLKKEAGTVLLNLSSLYFHIKDFDSALAVAEDAYRILPKNETWIRTQLLTQLGRVLLIRGDGGRARPYFDEAIRDTSRTGDKAGESLAYDLMGMELTRAGDLQSAEAALQRAFSLRKSDHAKTLFVTEYNLALLKLKQSDFTLARHYIDAAFSDPGRDSGQVPNHLMYLARAQIRAGSGDLEGAMQDYLRATSAADDWRRRGLAADVFRISSDDVLHDVYEGAIDTAMHLYQRTGESKYAELSWELNERILGASLRESLLRRRDGTTRLGPEYPAMLDKLRALEAMQLASNGALSRQRLDEMARLRMHLAEVEARAGAEHEASSVPTKEGSGTTHWGTTEYTVFPENSDHRLSLKQFRQGLGRSRTLISFHTGEKNSYRWVVSGKVFEVSMLPGKRQIESSIGQLRAAIREANSDSTVYGGQLYSELFGNTEFSQEGHQWFVAPDSALFDLPFSALVCDRRNGRPVYLIERETIEVVPGAWAIGPHSAASSATGFLGLGDGIYNTADARFTPPVRNSFLTGTVPAMFAGTPETVQLPRLVASLREIEQCARLSGGPARILTGTSATRQQLVAALKTQPAIIHIAAHFLTDNQERTSIALGLTPGSAESGVLDILTPEDIVNLDASGAIVVMSGCSSGKGRIVPAAGLLGLGRAWLAAGASAVITTQWPVPDDTGEMLARFYEYLRSPSRGDTLAPAEALRRAQMDMLRSNSWRSEPRYWAAYQIMGRSN